MVFDCINIQSLWPLVAHTSLLMMLLSPDSAADSAVITAPSSVCAESTGNQASVTGAAGSSYGWSISGGEITAGANSSEITFNAGSGTSLTLTAHVTNNTSVYGESFANLAGWTVAEQGSIAHQASGGNPGGFLRMTFNTPAPPPGNLYAREALIVAGAGASSNQLFGDFSAQYGGLALQFDFRPVSELPDELFLDFQGGIDLWSYNIDTATLATNAWNTITVPIDYQAGWMTSGSDSEIGFVSSLGSVDGWALYISQYTQTAAAYDVDNFTLLTRTSTSGTAVVSIDLPPAGGMATAADSTVRPDSGTTITLSGHTASGVTIAWLSSTTSASAGFTVIPGASGTNLVTGPLAVDTWFYAEVSGDCGTGTSTVAAVSPVAVVFDAIWDGGGDDNATTNNLNWEGDVYPQASSNSIMRFAGSTRTTPVITHANGSDFGSIRFNADASPFTVSGNDITLHEGIVSEAAGTMTITNTGITLGSNITVDSAIASVWLHAPIRGDYGINKTGEGTLTLWSSNSYAGLTIVSNGILQVTRKANTLGSTDGATIIKEGANVQILNTAPDGTLNSLDEPFVLAGAGPGGANAALTLSIAALPIKGAWLLEGDATIRVAALGGRIILSNAVDLAGYTLSTYSGIPLTMAEGSYFTNATKTTGNGALYLGQTALSSTSIIRPGADFTGTITLNGGTLQLAPNSSGSGLPAGGFVDMADLTQLMSDSTDARTVHKDIKVNGTVGFGGNSTNFSGPLTLNGNIDLGGETRTIQNTFSLVTINGAMTNGGFNKTGTGTVVLAGANLYSGNTIISNGTIRLSGTGSIANTPVMHIAPGATFDVSARSSTYALGAQTLRGPSTAGSAGSIVAGGSAGLALGASSTLDLPYFESGTAPLQVAGGLLSLHESTTVIVHNAGAALAAGNHKIIATNGAGGAVLAATTLPAVAVTGNGISTVTENSASLAIIDGELYIRVGTPVSYTLTIAQTIGGSTTPEAGIYTYTGGSTALVTAAASPFRDFTGWSGDVTSGETSIAVVMNANKSLLATFVEQRQGGVTPLWWLNQYGLGTNDLADSDGDGASNREEYLANTNPTNSIDKFELLVAREGQQYRIDMPTRSGPSGVEDSNRYYRLLSQPTLTGPWTNTVLEVSGDDLTHSITVTNLMDSLHLRGGVWLSE